MTPPLWTREDELALLALKRAVKDQDLAGALLAIEGGGVEVELRTRALLDSWGQRVADKLHSDDPEDALHALSTVLVDELGLKGAGETYDAPENSYLSSVLDSRHGLPILVTAVWRVVGGIAGIQVEGVGMPFHFIARVGGEDGLLIDPFKGGKVLSLQDCADMIDRFSDGRIDWDPLFLEVSDTQAIVERVLRNLMNAFSHQGDLLGLYRAIGLIAALCPDEPHYRLAQGRMAEFLGQPNVASRVYTDLLQAFEGTEEATLATERLVAMSPGGLPN